MSFVLVDKHIVMVNNQTEMDRVQHVTTVPKQR
jgi:hypothetical protein